MNEKPIAGGEGIQYDLASELTCYVPRPPQSGKVQLAMEIGEVCDQIGLGDFEIYRKHLGDNERYRVQGFYVVFKTIGDAMAFKLTWGNR